MRFTKFAGIVFASVFNTFERKVLICPALRTDGCCYCGKEEIFYLNVKSSIIQQKVATGGTFIFLFVIINKSRVFMEKKVFLIVRLPCSAVGSSVSYPSTGFRCPVIEYTFFL